MSSCSRSSTQVKAKTPRYASIAAGVIIGFAVVGVIASCLWISGAAGASTNRGRWIKGLPAPLVSYEVPRPWIKADPLHKLIPQAQLELHCIEWVEAGGGMEPSVHNHGVEGSSGSWQMTAATWNEFKSPNAPRFEWQAPEILQDRVMYRMWRIEQAYAYNGDPCIGHRTWYVINGRAWGWWSE